MNKEVQERERSVKKKIRNKADYEKADKLIPKVSKTLFNLETHQEFLEALRRRKEREAFSLRGKERGLINTSQKAIDFKTSPKKVRKYRT